MTARGSVTTELLKMQTAGPLTASRYVREVEPPNHPLHDTLEWDDAKASHEYRLIQARKIIVLVRDPDDTGPRRMPLFLHVPSPDGGEGEYHLARDVVVHAGRLDATRGEVLRHLGGARNNLAEIDELVRRYGVQETSAEPKRRATARRHIEKAVEVLSPA